MRTVLGLQVLTDTKYLSLRTTRGERGMSQSQWTLLRESQLTDNNEVVGQFDGMHITYSRKQISMHAAIYLTRIRTFCTVYLAYVHNRMKKQGFSLL